MQEGLWCAEDQGYQAIGKATNRGCVLKVTTKNQALQWLDADHRSYEPKVTLVSKPSDCAIYQRKPTSKGFVS